MLSSGLIFDVVLSTIVLPVTGAAAALLGLWLLDRRGPACRRLGPAVGLGYLIGHLAVAGTPRLPPIGSTQGMFYVALLASCGSAIAVRQEMATRARRVFALLVVATLLWLTLRPMVRYTWGVGESLAWLSVLAVVGCFLWAAFNGLSQRVGGTTYAIGWLITYAGTGILLLISHTALLAQLSFVMAAVLAGLLLLAALSRVEGSWTSAVPMLFCIHGALLLAGTFYADLASYQAIALAVAPLGMVLGQMSRDSQWKRLLFACLGVLLLLTPVLAVAAVDYLKEEPSVQYED